MVMDKQQRSEVLKAYEAYLKAFIASDMATINSLVQYPFTHIGEGSVNTFDHFPKKPSEMREMKGWATSEGFEIDIVAVSETKAHVIMRNTRRIRDDGSLIEEASAFYAYTKTTDGWKMFAASDIILPA